MQKARTIAELQDKILVESRKLKAREEKRLKQKDYVIAGVLRAKRDMLEWVIAICDEVPADRPPPPTTPTAIALKQ